jgi:hypothetical protein
VALPFGFVPQIRAPDRGFAIWLRSTDPYDPDRGVEVNEELHV